MRVGLVGGLLAAALVAGAPAVAADMPVKAAPAPIVAPTWNGTYIGINGGFGWGRSDLTNTVAGVTSGDFNLHGGLAGITYGGNWQAGHVVLGFESDFDWAHINGSVTNAGCGGTCFTNTRWLSTERMRAGWDVNGWLFYGTVGVAFADVNTGIIGCPVAGICGSGTRAGWTAGAGVETMFWQNWSAKIEYLHYDLGNRVMLNAGAPIAVLDRGDVVRAGINYHFDMLGLLHLN